MRAFILPTLLVVAVLGYGTNAAARKTSGGSGHWEMLRALDDAFDHTANLRGGAGICGVDHARQPGVPTVFHIEREDHSAGSRFVKDDATGTWIQNLDGATYGSVVYTDSVKRHPVAHDLRSTGTNRSGEWTKVDAKTREGVTYRSETTVSEGGSGGIQATGLVPEEGRYSLTGCWAEGNVGAWSQRWEAANGRWEADAYQTHADGTARLTVATGKNLKLDLAFAADRSGRGTIVNAKGLTAKIEWDNQGDGTILWADGATQTFEDWKI